MKVLIVTTDQNFLKECATFLKKECYTVLAALGYEQALDMALLKKPEIVVVSNSSGNFNEQETEAILKMATDSTQMVFIDWGHDLEQILNRIKSETPVLIIKKDNQEALLSLCKRIYQNLSGSGNSVKTEADKNPCDANKHILIVEDDKLNQLFFEDIINDLNITTTVIDNYREAEAEVLNPRYDLILSDVNLKDGSGVDLFNRVNVLSSKKPPFFIISGFSKTELFDRYGKIDCEYIINKPIDPSKLSKLIQEALQCNKTAAVRNKSEKNGYDFSEVIRLLSDKPEKVDTTILNFVSYLKEAKIAIEKTMVSNDYESLRRPFHNILNLCKYFGGEKLYKLIFEFKSIRTNESKQEMLEDIHVELGSIMEYCMDYLNTGKSK